MASEKDKGGRNMKKLLLATILLVLAIVVPIPAMAQINIHIDIPLPPPITFAAPPEVIVMPETEGVYVAPEIDVDLFFWNGFWWRLWEGRWYRSAYYDRDWVYYNNVPSFYFHVDPHWRTYYHNHNWYGHNWNYQRIPYQGLQQNWKSWQAKKSWGGQKTWGVQGYVPRTQAHTQVLRQQRQEQYQQKPEVQKHMEYQQQQRQVQKPQGQQRQQQQHQPQGQQHQGGSQHPQTQGKPQGGDAEHRK
jgi:hypothetical protein